MSELSVVVGIDIAKAHVEVAVLGASVAPPRFVNDSDGHTALIALLQPLAVQLVVMEATGGYEAAVACALQAAGLPVAVVNPRRGRDFAKALGRLAKTDRIDADGLAELGRMLLNRPDLARYLRPLESLEQQDLAALVTRRRQLVAMLGMERQRLSFARPAVRPPARICSCARIASVPWRHRFCCWFTTSKRERRRALGILPARFRSPRMARSSLRPAARRPQSCATPRRLGPWTGRTTATKDRHTRSCGAPLLPLVDSAQAT
jgi:hypothetical protein